MEEEEEEEVEEGEDQEEEAWLDALEAGEVDERGYLPQTRDSSSLTARQVRESPVGTHNTNILAYFVGGQSHIMGKYWFWYPLP